MKKILFICTRNPYSDRFSGDVIGSKKIINIFKKNSFLDVVTLGKEDDFSKKNIFVFGEPTLLTKIYNIIKFSFLLQPMQFGLFYSKQMKRFIEDNASNYEIIFFYHIRSSQYLPNNYFGKTIIEMGDLYSRNYEQTFSYLNIFNPIKYIYLVESFLMKKIEKNIFSNFDKIILFSKNEIKKIDKIFSKKIIHIDITIDKIKKNYLFSKNNKTILFVGNLTYLPNILAVKSFIRNILPKLILKIPGIKFEIIGEINKFNKFFLSLNRNLKCWGKQKNLDQFVKRSFCGLANLNIATGVQGKILSYMSNGLPVICSKKVANNFGKNVISFNDGDDLIKKIIKLKNDKKFSNQISKKSFHFVKKFTLERVKKNYLKVMKI